MHERYDLKPAEPRLVFSDPNGKRRRVLALCLVAFTLALFAMAYEFVSSVNSVATQSSAGPDFIPQTPEQVPTRDLRGLVLAERPGADCTRKELPARPVSGFVPSADETALSSLRRNCARLSEVFYGSSVLGQGPDGEIATFGGFPLWEARGAGKPGTEPARWPFLSPEVGTSPEELADLLGQRSEDLVAAALPDPARAAAEGVTGVCLDLSAFGRVPAQIVRATLRELRSHLAGAALGTCIVGPSWADFLTDADVLALADIAIAVLVAPEPSAATAPAPMAWLGRQLDNLTRAIPADRLRIAVSVAGISWEGGQRRSSLVPYAVAMEQAVSYGVDPVFDKEAASLLVSFIDTERRPNRIWLPDAIIVSRILDLIPRDVSVVLWPLGYEDPSLWRVLDGGKAQSLGDVSLGSQVILKGEGSIAVPTYPGRPGQRSYQIAPEVGAGLARLTYDIVPLAPRVETLEGRQVPSLVVTFDGLGREDDLEAVLAGLSGANARATFMLGLEDALFGQARIERVLQAGHSLGLLVPRETAYGDFRDSLQRFWGNLTLHAVQHHVGLLPLVARRPGGSSRLGLETESDLRFMQDLAERKRIAIPTGLAAPYGRYQPEAFHHVILDAALAYPDNVLRIDFSEENSSAAAASFKQTLDLLLAEGLSVEALPDILAGETYSLDVRPQAETDLLANVVYGSLRITWTSVEDFFLVLAIVVMLRAPIQIALALAWRNRFPVDPAYEPEVTVIVPAFNEEQVIERTVRSILKSDYDNLRVIVVDDGSSDRTAAIVKGVFGEDDRVTLIRETNHGKWYAEDIAINHIDSPIFVVIDADTLLDPNAVRFLVQPFRDPTVGSVAGTVEVGNRVNFLTRCQTVEYMVAQALMRRAYQAFNGIMVVPGAIGAWRTEAVLRAGMVTGDTIAEDADLTVAVNRANYRVVYQPRALSYTEAPETLSQFMKQRLRWSLGLLQVSWKHRRAIIEGRGVGVISIVEAFWYRVVSGVVYPILDLVILLLLLEAIYSVLNGDTAAIAGFSPLFFIAIAILVLIDLVNFLLAVWIEKRGQWSLLFIVPLLRLGFVQLLYISSCRALYHAITGKLDVWDKVYRTGKARIPTVLLR